MPPFLVSGRASHRYYTPMEQIRTVRARIAEEHHYPAGTLGPKGSTYKHRLVQAVPVEELEKLPRDTTLTQILTNLAPIQTDARQFHHASNS